MKLYLASMNLEVLLKYHQLFPQRRLNVLRSFGRLDKHDYGFVKKHRKKVGGLILDSGTWTLNNAKTPSPAITLPNYIRHLSLFGKDYDFYFSFDSDFTENGFGINFSNMREMEEAGVKPVPVVHDILGKEIDEYIERGYKRVALGSKQIKKPATLEYAINRFKGTCC